MLHSISREAVLRTAAAPFEPTRLITRLITRLLLRFELPGGYFGTTRLIIRLVVQRIIRLVVYYQLKADNPAGNPAVSFVVLLLVSDIRRLLMVVLPPSPEGLQ